MSAKSGSTAELKNQDSNHSKKEVQTHKVMNSMIVESTGDVGNTSNDSHTLKEEEKTLDDQSTKEGMAEDEDYKVSSPSLQGKPDYQVNNTTDSPDSNKATLDNAANHVPDECKEQSVHHQIASLSSVNHNQTNSFQTQKERPHQAINKHKKKQGPNTAIQNNDLQKEAIHNHKKRKTTLQNKEPNPPQAKPTTGPNYEEQKFKHEQRQGKGKDKGNFSDFSSQVFTSEVRNIPDPQTSVRESHQNDHCSIRKSGEQEYQEQDANEGLIEESFGQRQEASQEDNDASEVENDEFYS